MSIEKVEDASIDQIKEDLSSMAEKVPIKIWNKFGQQPTDPSLYLFRIFRTRYILPPTAGGHDALHLTLEKDGQISERLVHWVNSDTYDRSKRSPDEILGDASENDYRRYYPLAVQKLCYLIKQSKRLSPR